MNILENKYSVGEIVEVTITKIDYDLGAFVSMQNGMKGLIYINDFAWFNQSNRLKNFSIGDTLEAKIIRISEGIIELSRKEILPNPRTIERGAIISDGIIRSIKDFGLIISLGDFSVLALWEDVPFFKYSEGDIVNCVVIENVFNEQKHRNDIKVSILALYENYAKNHSNGSYVKGIFKRMITSEDKVFAVIDLDQYVRVIVPSKNFIEPFKSRLLNSELETNEELDFVFSYDKKNVRLDMKPIEKEKKEKKVEELCAQLHIGDIVEAIVRRLNDQRAIIEIQNTGFLSVLSREELSPNKVIRATDEVFKGEIIKVKYIGNKDGQPLFSRKDLVSDDYSDNLYDLSLTELLTTMELTTNRFVGKVIEIKSDRFMENLMTIGEEDYKNNGKLLVDPVNGKNIIAFIDNRLRNLFTIGDYYEVELDIASKEYRKKQGTPYMFCVCSNKIKKVSNPYKDMISRAFREHRSPSTNASIANLLEEVGENLYSSKKRMFYELLQNADDAAAEKGVRVKLQINNDYFILAHDGYSFNQHDFESIISAAKSTKRANDKKTGYKGIGFKSVFTNSHSVFIKSGGYKFAFDKEYPCYNNFEEFYFLVNKIKDDPIRQKEFCNDFAKYKIDFEGVKNIPWQLLPIWYDKEKISENSHTIFDNKENVAIALKMDKDTLIAYNEAIREVFEEPRFMLFLRRTNRVQLINGGECLTIQKNRTEDGRIISLISSSGESLLEEKYNISTYEGLEVNDRAFLEAGVLIQRKERTNNKGEKENYFVKVDTEGEEQGEVTGIPDRIASTKDTAISFAIKLDKSDHIVPLEGDILSLYAYLPMNEHRFRFPFYINADFLPKSDREGIQSDNPWNHFIFYTIGKLIVRMVAKHASKDEKEYLNLLPTKELESNSQDTKALVESFNRGYKEALSSVKFILDEQGELIGIDEVGYDMSGLAAAIGAKDFYILTGIDKHLTYNGLDSEILKKEIFKIEKYTTSSIYDTLSSRIEIVKNWLASTSEKVRNQFYQWLTCDEKTKGLIDIIPTFTFGNEWKTNKEINLDNNLLILTQKISSIKEILIKLGFSISKELFESHPLHSYFKRTEDKKIFEKIQNSNIEKLTFRERLSLFKTCIDFDGVGGETLRKWKIFKNQKGEFSSLGTMFEYYEQFPSWIFQYVLNKEEDDIALTSYLIPKKREEIYSSIIVPKIDEILAYTNITQVYTLFKQSWTAKLTESLFGKTNINRLDLLTIVEQSDNSVKESFIRTNKQFPLNSNSIYHIDSFEYRLLKLAVQNNKTIEYIQNITSIDGKKLSEYTKKDELTITINNLSYEFRLSEILQESSSSSVLSRVVSNFKTISGYQEIFAQKEASPSEVIDQLCQNLKVSGCFITAEQFCFLMLYRRNEGYHRGLDDLIINSVRLNEDIFLSILNKLVEKKLGKILGETIKNVNIHYPFGKIGGTYFDSDEYTLPKEQTPKFICKWADTQERKQLLIDLGAHDSQSKEIERRKSFKEGKNDNIWNISDTHIIRSFLDWVSSSFELPIINENQVRVLRNSFEILKIPHIYKEEDYFVATEWTNNRYLEWKKGKGMKIFIIEGSLPCRGIYNNIFLFKDYEGQFAYFEKSRTLYISSNKKPEIILAEVYLDKYTSQFFTKEDWDKIFLISVDVVLKKDEIIAKKDERIAELERLLGEKGATHDTLYEDNSHRYTERDNTDEEDRKELNREARYAAKDFLDSLEDYDCTDWNPDESGYIVKDKILFKGKKITVGITSSRNRKLYLHPYLFAEIMEDPDNLLLNYGYDHKIHSLKFEDIFMDNPNVNLIFDTDVVNPKHIAELANKYRTSKKTCFVIENPKYSVSGRIDSFGLKEKKEGAEININFSDEDIFG